MIWFPAERALFHSVTPGKRLESNSLSARLDPALADSPFNLEKSRSEEIVAGARRIIDAHLAT